MKYQVGDTILVLHSNEEGTVVELMNEKMVMIEIDKVRFPVYMVQTGTALLCGWWWGWEFIFYMVIKIVIWPRLKV